MIGTAYWVSSLSSPLSIALLVATSALEPSAAELQYKIRVRNLTYQQPFSQIGVFAHTWNIAGFEEGVEASSSLKLLAETGDLSYFLDPNDDGDAFAYLCGIGVGTSALVFPGETERITLLVDETVCPDGPLFSMMAMLVNTNDAFVGIDSVELMTTSSSKLYPPAYDAGTEANNELCSHIPGPACSSTSGNEEAEPGEGHVHIHRGIYGIGELSAVEYDWKTPVAEVFISEPTLV